MSRVLTGIQSTGVPHLGNLLGAIIPAIEMANNSNDDSFLFIANLHSLTQIKQRDILIENTYSVAATWLAFGLNPERTVFYKQSDVPQTLELCWYLSCFFPYKRLTLAHSFKDKANRLDDTNTGLFTYPVLMASDILLYDADIVPVGKDQIQHIEFARDIASRFNHKVGKNFILPKAKIIEKTQCILGTDGTKMSKSKGNTIDIFLTDKKLYKQILKIRTDSKAFDEPKNPDTCNLFSLYKLLASDRELAQMRENYKAGNYGYGNVKQDFYKLLLDTFSEQRRRYFYFMENRDKIDSILEKGAQKARLVADEVLKRTRSKIGY